MASNSKALQGGELSQPLKQEGQEHEENARRPVKKEEVDEVGEGKASSDLRLEGTLDADRTSDPGAERSTNSTIDAHSACEGLTPVQQELYARVQEAKKRIPRFLFRCDYHRDASSSWDSELLRFDRLIESSEGDEGNVPDKLIPNAFSDGRSGPRSFYSIEGEDIAEIAAWQVARVKPFVRSPFTSWCQSLTLILRFAANARPWLGESLLIFILDTGRLDPRNVVLHTGDFEEVVQAGLGELDQPTPKPANWAPELAMNITRKRYLKDETITQEEKDLHAESEDSDWLKEYHDRRIESLWKD